MPAKAKLTPVKNPAVSAVESLKRDGYTYFVSTNEERTAFPLVFDDLVIRSSWNKERNRLYWRVPNSHVQRLTNHHFVVTGRIGPTEEVEVG